MNVVVIIICSNNVILITRVFNVFLKSFLSMMHSIPWQYEKQRYDLFFNAESGTLKLRRPQKIFFKTLLNVVLIVRYKLKLHSSSSINTTFKWFNSNMIEGTIQKNTWRQVGHYSRQHDYFVFSRRIKY